MKKKSVSIRGELYSKFMEKCLEQRRTMSSVLEELLQASLPREK